MNPDPAEREAVRDTDPPKSESEEQYEELPPDETHAASTEETAPAPEDEEGGEVKDKWIRRWKDDGGTWLPTD